MKTSLILEGGGMRGMFTNGVIDVLMENVIEFDALAGVSAGVLFGCNYKSRQPGRALRYNLRFCGRRDYMSWWSLLTTGDFVNEKFSYHTMPCELDRFDFETYRTNPLKLFAVATDIVEGKPVYHEIADAWGDGLQWMRASSSMPVFARPVRIGEGLYLDGGITDSIPLRFMNSKGYERNIVVLTQPADYFKHPSHLYWPMRLFLPKYPKVAELMARRHEMYNEQLCYIKEQERLGNALLIYPDRELQIGRLEMNPDKFRAIYEQGRRKAEELLPQIRDFLNETTE